MKCINRRKKSLIVLLSISTILLSSCGKTADLALSYDVYETSAEYGLMGVKESSSITPFASDLCVAGTSDITLSEVTTIASTCGAGLFDLTDKEVLYSKNLHKKLYPASTTKILTALVALKYGDLSDVITVSADAVDLPSDASICHLHEGDTLTLEQALYGLMLCSGNDAANAIAEQISGSIDNFADLMNQEAESLGATNSHFVNPHGLHDEDHYTTVYDLYLIFNEAIQNDEFEKIINTKSYTANFKDSLNNDVTLSWVPTNHYFAGTATVPDNVTVIGGKTGTTYNAGSCLVLLSENKDGNKYISIVLNADGKELLYAGMNSLLEEINQ